MIPAHLLIGLRKLGIKQYLRVARKPDRLRITLAISLTSQVFTNTCQIKQKVILLENSQKFGHRDNYIKLDGSKIKTQKYPSNFTKYVLILLNNIY